MSYGTGGNKAFSPFTSTLAPNQQVQMQPTQTSSQPFSFGTTATPGTGFALGGTNTGLGGGGTSSAPQLSFTAPTPGAATTGALFSFTSQQTTAAAPGQGLGGLGGAGATGAPAINFGLSSGTTATSAAPASGFGGFGGGATATLPQLSFGGSTTTTATQPTLSFGAPPATAATQPSLSFGAPPATAATQPSLSFGAPPTTAAATTQAATVPPISFSTAAPAAAPTSTVQPTFGMPSATQSTAAPTLTLGSTPATTAAAAPLSGFTFGGGTGTLGITNPIKPTTTTAAPTAPNLSLGGAPAAAPQLSTATTTTQSNSTNVSQMNFRQLQEAINKWMLDLQEQEKVFLDQATKVNAWDRTLITNGDKISKLNESVTKVKTDHTRLEHALDYLKTQQQEFEAFLEPLEAGLPVNVPVEPEREHLYSLTENVDTQLQQMAEDLKEVIRHINESNKTVDKNDPISQILRILNEHTDALQWVEDNANGVRKSLEDVSKQHQMARKEHERTLRMMFK